MLGFPKAFELCLQAGSPKQMIFPENTHGKGQPVWPDVIPSQFQIYGSVMTVAELCHISTIKGITERERVAGLSQEEKRRFDESGEEKKRILQGQRDQGPPTISLSETQPAPWTSNVKPHGHNLLQHSWYMNTQRKGMSNSAPDRLSH